MKMVRLLHLVCSSDRLIDEHKSECYHTFVGSLTKGHEALKGTNVEDCEKGECGKVFLPFLLFFLLVLLDMLEYEGITEDLF